MKNNSTTPSLKVDFSTPIDVKKVFKQGKYNKKFNQLRIVYNAFYSQPKTMLMVSFETGILRANICRYVSQMRKYNVIRPVKTGLCRVSKHGAVYYTTNPEYFEKYFETLKH